MSVIRQKTENNTALNDDIQRNYLIKAGDTSRFDDDILSSSDSTDQLWRLTISNSSRSEHRSCFCQSTEQPSCLHPLDVRGVGDVRDVRRASADDIFPAGDEVELSDQTIDALIELGEILRTIPLPDDPLQLYEPERQ